MQPASPLHNASQPFPPRAQAGRQARAAQIAHMQRCRTLPPLRTEEAQDLVAAFLASRGATRCPPAYAVAIQGA